MNDKYLWCPTCQCYPDEIKEEFDWAVEHRKWNVDTYELEDVDYGDCHPVCEKCGTNLEERDQDVETMPKVQSPPAREVSGEENL